MEQECITGLYHYLGVPVGGEFSSEDVCVLFHKVFHLPSSIDDVHMAIKKISGNNEDWSCIGEKVLDLLLEMERERERKEELYWDLQLVNVGKLNTLYMMDKQDNIDSQAPSSRSTLTDTTTFKQAQNGSDSGSIPSRPIDMDISQRQRGAGYGEQAERIGRCVGRLRRAARQRWARLVTEGMYSLLPSLWLGPGQGIRGQAWGCVSLSDLILLVEVKYDQVSHTLYAEMLQEHHGLTVWENLLPWQRDKGEGALEELAEEALESGDLLHLADLPGAFRIYRSHEGVSSTGCPDWLDHGEQSWSAISLLTDIHNSRHQEKDTLTALSKRLDLENLRLLCLYIRLATLRAQRENMSYGALLAARQAWETWPCVSSPCKREQASLWLQEGEEEEREKELCISISPQQQAVVQWLVLSQEQERKYLLRLLCGVSLDDLQGPEVQGPPRAEQNQREAVLREGCLRRLRHIHTTLQTHTETQLQPELKSPQPVFHPQRQSKSESQTLPTQNSPQTQPQSQDCGLPVGSSQPQWRACALVLLSQLMELQESQVSTVLPTLVDMSVQHLLIMREKYESELQEHRLCNLLQLLTSDAPPTADSLATTNPTGPITDQGSSTVDSVERAREEPQQPVRAESGTERQDLCTGCGAAVEDLPYLEILCVSNTTHTPADGHTADGGAQEEQAESSPRRTPQSYKKQGSLIALAWSTPPEDNTDSDYQAEAAVGGTAEEQDNGCCVSAVDRPGDAHGTPGPTHPEETHVGSHMVLDFLHTQFADQQCSTVVQMESMTGKERLVTEQLEKRTVAPRDSDPQTHGLIAETLEAAAQPHPSALAPEFEEHVSDVSSELTNAEAYLGAMSGVRMEVETCSTQMETESELWDVHGLEPPYPQEPKYISQATVDCSVLDREATRESVRMVRERTREPVSVMERERTMRNLVDIQRKVEQKQQRDRERQLLRVKERLSIIQNRKAEEDLLGLNQTDRLWHLTHNLPQEDKDQQKTVVRERLEQLRRERSYVMQSKRDRNTAVFKELLGPVALHSAETEDGVD